MRGGEYQAGCEQFAAQSRPSSEIQLTEEARALVAAERDAEVRKLRDRAMSLELLSAEGYLVAEGLYVNSTHSDAIAGRLAKAGWDSITYDTSKGSWRAYGHSSEWHVQRSEVEAVLNGSKR